ncbi:MAG: hypothetical protein RI907_549 [Pseudomonadota bacterium]|jgi:thioredoxin reductase (NADPH)
MADRPVIETDVVVVGAGPAGLFQAFQLGLLGMSVVLVDALPEAGGQCTALYADKPIYDVPGIPVCTGRELTERLLQQAHPFLGAPLAPQPSADTTAPGRLWLNHLVASLDALPEGGFLLGTAHATTQATGPSLRARGVVLATGAGAFLPRGLGLAGLDGLANVHHHLSDAEQWAGQHVVVAGGGEEALSAVAHLLALPPALAPGRLTLMHRRAQWQAEPELLALVQEAITQGRVHLALGLPTAFAQEAEAPRLAHLNLLTPDSTTAELACDQLVIRLGLSPKLGPLQHWGLALERKQLPVDTAQFQTSLAHVHAIGDAVTYPGKLRLIVSGFHEATLAAHGLARHLIGGHPAQPLYTTTSAVLHDRLGLAAP